MTDKKGLDWIPLWVDKHLHGSTRLELEPDERSVWIDLLVLSAKHGGYVRANEGVPYLNSQLAGMLVIPLELLERTIKKCIKHGKIIKKKDGTLYLPSWDEYKLSPRHKRRFEAKSDKSDTMTESKDTIEREEKSKVKNSKEENTTLENEFNSFWNMYNLKTARPDAFKAFKALRRKGVDFQEIQEAVKGYANHIYNEKQRGFNKDRKYPAGFLRNEFWKDFIGVKKNIPL